MSRIVNPILPFPRSARDAGGGLPIDHGFDVDLANRLAEAESFNKHLYRPNAYLHKWWARRCGSTFRLILKHLITDSSARDYYAPGGLEGTVILDPMMGGGTTVHEAVRLGANVIGADIDPIPMLQCRASLTHVPLQELESAFGGGFAKIRASVAPYFQSSCPICGSRAEVRFVLHGQRRACACGEALFVDSFVLREETSGQSVRLCPRCGDVHQTGTACDCPDLLAAGPRLQEKGTKECCVCGERFTEILDTPF